MAGDALLTRAFGVLAEFSPNAAIGMACCRELAQAAGATQMVGGQADDLATDVADASIAVGIGNFEYEVVENVPEHLLERPPVDVDPSVETELYRVPWLELEHELDQRVDANRTEQAPGHRREEGSCKLGVDERFDARAVVLLDSMPEVAILRLRSQHLVHRSTDARQ